MTTKIDSMYEVFTPLCVLAKSHFVCWFSGDLCTSRWSTTIGGTGSIAAACAVDGGLLFTSGTVSNEQATIHHCNNAKHYNACGSVAIWVSKIGSTAVMRNGPGLSNLANFSGHLVVSGFRHDVSCNWVLSSSDGTLTHSASCTAVDTNFHVFNLKTNSGTMTISIDGILVLTKTSNPPTTALQPTAFMQTRTSSAKTMNLRYMEVYNT